MLTKGAFQKEVLRGNEYDEQLGSPRREQVECGGYSEC